MERTAEYREMRTILAFQDGNKDIAIETTRYSKEI